MRHRCINCQKMTEKFQRINSSPWHCYDGCFSTTGRDRRTYDGKPAWLKHGRLAAWHPSRMIDRYAA